MAEIKRLNSSVPMASSAYTASAMDVVYEGEKSRQRARRVEVALRKYAAAMAAVVIVFFILMQSIAIYTMQQNVSSINNEIISLKRSNETLRMTVLKSQNIGETKQGALAQEYIARADVKPLAVDLAYDNFTKPKTREKTVSWWGKIFAFTE